MDAKSPTDVARASVEVQRLVRQLRRMKAHWPKGVWLYATGNSLHLMATHADGSRTIPGNTGMDPDLSIEAFQIPNDGGDW